MRRLLVFALLATTLSTFAHIVPSQAAIREDDCFTVVAPIPPWNPWFTVCHTTGSITWGGFPPRGV